MPVEHRTVQANGINIHIAEAGTGPLVVLCHGFPETWYSWRHQVELLAGHGFHAVALDQRGYGRTDCPSDSADYTILHLVADVVALVQALQRPSAAIVGHDWGAIVAAHCALLRPDIFKAVCLLSVPYAPRQWGRHRPTEVMTRIYRGRQFYQLYFQRPGLAEAELELDVRRSLLAIFHTLSGGVEAGHRWNLTLAEGQKLLDATVVPPRMPSWLSETDLDVYEADFRGSGFRGGLNWYRNIDRNWELTASLTGAPILQPSMFAAGETDPVPGLYRGFQSTIEKSMPNLKETVILGGIGHWTTQENPALLNRHLVGFLAAYGR